MRRRDHNHSLRYEYKYTLLASVLLEEDYHNNILELQLLMQDIQAYIY